MTIQSRIGDDNHDSASVTRRIRVSSQVMRSGGEKKDNSKSDSDGESDGDDSDDEIRGRKKAQPRRNNKPLEVKLIFVEVNDEEREERLNRIAGIMIDSALSELGITKKQLTRTEDELQ